MTGRRTDGGNKNVVLVAHGSPAGAWNRVAEAFAADVQEAFPQWRCSLAFLGFGKPLFKDVLASAEEEGEGQLIVMPVLLAPGGHLLRDIDESLEALQVAAPRFDIQRLPTLLEDPGVRSAVVASIGRRLSAIES